MNTILLTVSIEEMNEYIGEVDVDIEISDENYESIVLLVNSYREQEMELTEELFEKELPDVYSAISEYVDSVMPDMIELDDDMDISDFAWYIQYPEDICDLF